MGIERFVWTDHAELRCDQRQLDRFEVEEAVKASHADRQVNDGRAEWLVRATTTDGVVFEAIYDHPHGNDPDGVRIVSVWRVDG